MWMVVLGTCWIQKQVHWLDFPFWIPGLQERKEGSGAGPPSLSVVALLRGMEASAHRSPTCPAPQKENWHQEGICQLWNQHCLAPALFILFSTEPEQPGKIIFMQRDKRTWQEWILIRFLKNCWLFYLQRVEHPVLVESQYINNRGKAQWHCLAQNWIKWPRTRKDFPYKRRDSFLNFVFALKSEKKKREKKQLCLSSNLAEKAACYYSPRRSRRKWCPAPRSQCWEASLPRLLSRSAENPHHWKPRILRYPTRFIKKKKS